MIETFIEAVNRLLFVSPISIHKDITTEIREFSQWVTELFVSKKLRVSVQMR
jgi:hypothetical protein